MEKRLTFKKGDIIANDGYGVFIITQKDRKIPASVLKNMIKHKIVFYERTQWGIRYYEVK